MRTRMAILLFAGLIVGNEEKKVTAKLLQVQFQIFIFQALPGHNHRGWWWGKNDASVLEVYLNICSPDERYYCRVIPWLQLLCGLTYVVCYVYRTGAQSKVLWLGIVCRKIMTACQEGKGEKVLVKKRTRLSSSRILKWSNLMKPYWEVK